MTVDATTLENATRRNQEVTELVERVRAGDLDAFEGIIRMHERRILGMSVQMGLSPEDSQDVCQEVFIRVFRYLAGFRAGKNFEVWLWRIAVNAVYDSLRKRRDRSEVSWDKVLEEGGEPNRPIRAGGLQVRLENADLCAKLLRRMDILTPQERMVFVLRELQEMETSEVARAMRISSVTVRRHGSSAMRKLRNVLDELDVSHRRVLIRD